jgi:hypothetical protein
MPAPYRGRREAAVTLNATCVACHPQEAAEWRASRHRAAYSNAAFQEALRIEPTAFCRGCHAPESDPAADPPPPVADLGVGCVTCHVVEPGVVLAAALSTVSHARRVGSHAFTESRDPAWLGDRLRVTAAQTSPGHGFPTGDLFRRLEVGGEIRDERGEVGRRDVKHLARQFAIVPGWPGRKLVADDRVFDEPTVVELALDPPPRVRGGTVSWWVTYQRVATVGMGTDPKEARIESEVRLHAGAFPWDG